MKIEIDAYANVKRVSDEIRDWAGAYPTPHLDLFRSALMRRPRCWPIKVDLVLRHADDLGLGATETALADCVKTKLDDLAA